MPPSDAPGAVTDDSRAATPLAASLQVELLGDSLHLVLQVTNTSPDVVPLTFRTGQSADFVVMQAERELWRWSAEQMFTQAIRRESLAPGETRSFEASWRPPHDLRGTVTARGFLTADEHSAEQQTEVRLP